jgi:hypothetical protein
VSNHLVLLNKPDHTPTFYSRVWHTKSSPDLVIAIEDIQKISHREVSSQLGGSDHKPVINTVQKSINREGKLPPSWNYKKADWNVFKILTDRNCKNIQTQTSDVDKAASLFTEAILSAAQESIPRGRRRDYKPFWTLELDKLQNQMNEAREIMEENPSEQNILIHNQLKELFEEEKAEQTRKSWHKQDCI